MNEVQKDDSSQGGFANKSGRVLEATVITLFKQHGFEEVSYRAWAKAPYLYGEELLLRDAPYVSIYGHNAKTEFLAQSKRLSLTVRIECKWQQSFGSVDEKFPYLYLNCIFAMPEDFIIVVIDGGGAKPSAVSWLKESASKRLLIPPEKEKKKIVVFSLVEFMAWANRALR